MPLMTSHLSSNSIEKEKKTKSINSSAISHSSLFKRKPNHFCIHLNIPIGIYIIYGYIEGWFWPTNFYGYEIKKQSLSPTEFPIDVSDFQNFIG